MDKWKVIDSDVGDGYEPYIVLGAYIHNDDDGTFYSDWFSEYYSEVDEDNYVRKRMRKVRFRYDENYVVTGKEYKKEDDESKAMNLVLEANDNISNGNYSKASYFVEEALTIDSYNPDAWNIMGLVNNHFGQYEESKECFDKSIKYGESQTARDNKANMIRNWVKKLDSNCLNDLNKAITLLCEAIGEIDFDDSKENFEAYVSLRRKFKDKLEKIEKLMEYPGEDLITITGTQFYYVDFEFNEGLKLELIKEPYNKYDSDAIAVYYNGEKIGYVANKDTTAHELTTQASRVNIPNNIDAEFLLAIDGFYVGRIKRENAKEKKKTLMGFKIVKDKKEYDEIMTELRELMCEEDDYGIEVVFKDFEEDIYNKELDEIIGATGKEMDDDISYHLRFDKEFIENMPEDLFAKTVTFPHAIPDLFAGFIKRYNPTLGKERHDFLDYHKEIVDEMQRLRFTQKQLIEECDDHHYSEYICIEFLKKYPEYKQLISHIDITKYGTMGGPYEKISLDEFIDNIYYNPYLNEKKHLLKYGFE